MQIDLRFHARRRFVLAGLVAAWAGYVAFLIP